jgi:hypothetical protein
MFTSIGRVPIAKLGDLKLTGVRVSVTITQT